MLLSPITVSHLLLYLDPCGKYFNFSRIGEETLLTIHVSALLKALTFENKLKGVWFHVANEGAFKQNPRPLYGRLLKSMGKHNGIPDFAIVGSEKSAFMELKSKKGKLSDSQSLFLQWATRHHIPCAVITDISQVEPFLKEAGMIEEI